MPFKDNTFQLVVYDPPHLINAGESSWLAKKYGKLNSDTWRQDLKQGFNECMRVLEDKGKTFDKFVSQLKNLGYDVEFNELTACDYGAPTKRKRFFMITRCDSKPIVWPEPTHGERNSKAVLNGLLKPYVPAYECIDFSLPCPSIFDTSEEIKEKYGLRAVRPLANKTMKRIAMYQIITSLLGLYQT